MIPRLSAVFTLVVVLSTLGFTAMLSRSAFAAPPATSAPPLPPGQDPVPGLRWNQTCENIRGGMLDVKVREHGLNGYELITVLGNADGFIACFKRPA